MASHQPQTSRLAKATKVIGISCFYHDSAVAAVEDGRISFAIHEERLSRVKHDSRFPIMAFAKTLETCKWKVNDVDVIVFYENPSLKLQRLYDQVITGWPRTWTMYSQRIPRFYEFKYPIERVIREKLGYRGEVRFGEHHRSHAASAFYTSPFERALVLTIDGVGEYDTTAVFIGEGNSLTKVASVHFPDSLGLLYSVFTQFLGFQINEDEYKVMGLAPYGKPRYVNQILAKMVALHDDGSFELNLDYFDFSREDRHYSPRFEREMDAHPRRPTDHITEQHQDLAASVQIVLERAIQNILKSLLREHPSQNLCMAGGVALNCTANAAIIREFGVNLHVHPAAGDAGGALGAAMDVSIKEVSENPYRFRFTPYLGLDHGREAIEAALKANGLAHQRITGIASHIANKLSEGYVVAIFHGRDEWGPRALGNRSILADPRRPGMKDHLNAKIKFREEFRPFAPAVMEEFFADYFETLGMDSSPYMLFTHRALRAKEIPAAVHVDGTARIQTVSESQNPYLHAILAEFYKITGVPVLINTSFNLKGEPIVSSPSDAFKTFFSSGIDFLAIEDYWIEKV